MAEQEKSDEAIMAALSKGELVDVSQIEPLLVTTEEDGQLPLLTRLTATIANFEGAFAAIKEALDYTRWELASERQAGNGRKRSGSADG